MFQRFGWVFAVTLIVFPALGLLGAGVFAYIQPKKYESTATVQVRPVNPSALVVPGTITPAPTGSATFFPTEFEVIRATRTLDMVIEDLDLTNRWGVSPAAARQQLQGMISTENIRGTDLIEIKTRASSPQDAILINNAVCDAYRERRRELEYARSDAAMQDLREAVRSQEDLVEERRKVLTQMIRNEKILTTRNSTNTPADGAAEAAKRYALLESQRIKLESQIETLLLYDGGQLVTYAAGLNLPENVVRTLHPQWLDAKRQLEALKQGGLGDSHPTVQQQTKIVEELRADLDQGVVALRETLRAQLALTKEQAERLRERNPPEEGLVLPLTRPRQSFEEAKSDFDAAQSLLEQLKIKLISEEMQRRITEDPVIVHSDPVEPERPVSPNIPLTLAIGGGGGILLGLIAPLFLIPILNAFSKDEDE
ncbi:hypothetical protein HAHE_26520 [Haloferula helveola]|uniref:Uncharacterized protein n=1 Tax=Haloferula helveola TaxID=490095 RepID=A0ABM7RF01_9BACT|nr:hypothetical protein HAHE_26520 [Haloferula helveola]